MVVVVADIVIIDNDVDNVIVVVIIVVDVGAVVFFVVGIVVTIVKTRFLTYLRTAGRQTFKEPQSTWPTATARPSNKKPTVERPMKTVDRKNLPTFRSPKAPRNYSDK